MRLSSLQSNQGENVYYSPAYRKMVEDHLSYLKTFPKNTTRVIETKHAYKYEGDLNGLLLEYGIPVKYHWLIARLNGLHATSEYSTDMTTLLMPDFTEVDRLVQVHLTGLKQQ